MPFYSTQNVDNYFLSTECVKNFPVDEMEDSLWITGNLMLIKLWIEGWKTEMCKVWKIYIHIIHGVNTGKIGNAHRLYTAKPKVIHKVIHRLWIMLITVTRYRVESTKIELIFVRVRRTVWISCG